MRRMFCLITFGMGITWLAGCHRLPSPSGPAAGSLSEPLGRSTVGNGSDIERPEAGSAWFLGARPVRYCYERSSGFGASESEVRKLIEGAFRSWRAYLVEKRVNDGNVHPDRELNPSDPKLIFNSEALTRCDGTEDLTFFLGVTPPRVERIRRQYERPVGFAHRERFDPERGWSKGFVWIAPTGLYEAGDFPSWEGDLYPLSKTILHELGHVLGCGHVTDTLMDEKIAEKLRGLPKGNVFERRPGHGVDDGWQRELLLCLGCRTPERKARARYGGLFAADLLENEKSQYPGTSAATVRTREPGTALSFTLFPRGVVSDAIGADTPGKTFDVLDLHRIALIPSQAPIFKLAFNRGSQLTIRQSFTSAAVYLGKLLDRSDREVPVTVTRNGPEANLSIRRPSGDPQDGVRLDFEPR